MSALENPATALPPPPSIGPTSPIQPEEMMSPEDGQPIGIVLLLLTIFFVSCNTFLVTIVLRLAFNIVFARIITLLTLFVLTISQFHTLRGILRSP